MKLLFDESMSPRLALLLRDLFPGSESALRNGLARAGDRRILDHRLTAELEAEAPRKSPGNLTHIPNPASREPRRTRTHAAFSRCGPQVNRGSFSRQPSAAEFPRNRRSRNDPRAVAASGDRHRGGGHPPTPATPPCIRVRTRRFETVTLTVLEQ